MKPVSENNEGRTVRIAAPEAPVGAPTPAAQGAGGQQYRIRAKIGGGGMGVVYLAEDVQLGRFVALKRLTPQAKANASLRRRFLNEAKAVASLSHIYIVHIYGIGEDDEGPFIAMEYVAGQPSVTGVGAAGTAATPPAPVSLETRVSENGQYTVDEAVDLLIKISKAVSYAHGRGVIHRDLKPANILLDASGEPKVIDFGLALMTQSTTQKITVPGEKLLSLGYGAPEQESGTMETDERADVYGLGGILYFVITGQNPRYFREQDIPSPLRDLLVKALATDRELRWPSAQAFLDALESVRSRTRIEQPPTKTTWRCKWCDTINPITIRFCSECGWDGVDECPECGTENPTGSQFCSKCGTDIRMYENVRTILAKISKAADACQNEKVVMLSSSVKGFEPSGESGRGMLRDVGKIVERSRQKLARIEQLKSMIPMEMRADNYERASSFIAEYRRLSGDESAYADEAGRIPSLLAERDVNRARRALRKGEYSYALELCDGILDGVLPDDPDCLSLRRRVAFRRNVNIACKSLLLLAVLAIVYVMSLAPLARIYSGKSAPSWVVSAFKPALSAYGDNSPLGRPLSAYASLVSGRDDIDAFASGTPSSASAQTLATRIMESPRSDFEGAMAELKSRYDTFSSGIPLRYESELDKLAAKLQAAGDFYGLSEVQAERRRFAKEGTIISPMYEDVSELAMLIRNFLVAENKDKVSIARSVLDVSAKYEQSLSDLLKIYTRIGDMATATAIDAEIRRVSDLPTVVSARKAVADFDAAKTTIVDPSRPSVSIETVRAKIGDIVKPAGGGKAESK